MRNKKHFPLNDAEISLYKITSGCKFKKSIEQILFGININLYAETDKEQNLFNYSMNCSALFYIMTSSSIDLSSTKEIREDPEWKDHSLYATRLNDNMMTMANYFLHVLYDFA